MKLNKVLVGGLLAVMTAGSLSSCTDTIAFGNSFLDKAPGGSETKDTVFLNAEYTRQFVAGIYAKQYYGIPYRSSNSQPLSASYWQGKFDLLTDLYNMPFTGSSVSKEYYTGTFSATSGAKIYGYDTENVWPLVRSCYLLQENIGRTPNMSQEEKDKLVAETKCLIASAYFNLFKFYGGLPLVKGTFQVGADSYHAPRATVEETVKFMTDLLDQAAHVLPWAYTGAEAKTETGRWTKAAAMALKCKVLQFAASPLFNSDKPYHDGASKAEQDLLVWYGGYKPELWDACKTACEEFLNEVAKNGYYKMQMPVGTTQEDYRYAFRYGYINQESPEVIFSVRVTNSTHDSKYQGWKLMKDNERYSYCPTQEYIEMFPWADGTPFDWETAKRQGKLDQMFVKGDTVPGLQDLQNRVLTRDPRLYETARINGVPQVTEWSSGKCSGNIFENWVGGTTVINQPKTETGIFATGYANNKYFVGTCYDRQAPQWDVVRMSDIYLTYAEALIQCTTPNFAKALDNIDMVRARVGMGKLADCNPDKDLKNNKANLLEELLRERACELGFENERYFDLVRYKRADIFEKQLHGLRIFRLAKDENGQWKRVETKWVDGDKKTDKDDPTKPGFYEPTHFDYERFAITKTRVFWEKGFDTKWYLFPFPQTEVNKGYGLVQNPGW